MKTTGLIDKVECGKELHISPNQVLELVKKGMPCVYLSRRTLRFNLNACLKWAENKPALSKTKKQREAENRRRENARKKKTLTA